MARVSGKQQCLLLAIAGLLAAAAVPLASAQPAAATTTAAPTAAPPAGGNSTAGNTTSPNFGGIFKVVSPPIIWQFKPRYALGTKIPIQYYYDSLVTNIPATVGIAVAPQATPDKVVVLTLNQSGSANFTWDTSKFSDQITEGWWILKIWDMRNGDEKKGPITPPTEAGYVRPYSGGFNPFALYSGTPYVNDPNYCPLCSAGVVTRSGSPLLPLAVVFSTVTGICARL